MYFKLFYNYILIWRYLVKDKWIQQFQEDIFPVLIREFDPEKVLLFGSRISGGAKEDSDIDVIIVSKTFFDIPFVNRMGSVLKKIRFPRHIDFLCYTPDEFERNKTSSSILIDAIETGLFLVASREGSIP